MIALYYFFPSRLENLFGARWNEEAGNQQLTFRADETCTGFLIGAEA